jgi:hypothetical protein
VVLVTHLRKVKGKNILRVKPIMFQHHVVTTARPTPPTLDKSGNF